MTLIRAVLIGEEAAGSRVLRLLAARPTVTMAAVFADPRRRNDMGSVWTTAEKLGFNPLPAEDVRSEKGAEALAGQSVDLLLNVHALHIVHPALLELPRIGAFNLHPGPLPEMAGLNVPSWAILLGHQEHTVTVHRMSSKIDEGPIAFDDRFPLSPNATGLSLSLDCVRRGVPLITRLLETVEQDAPVPATTQDLSRRRYFGRNPPNCGSIDFQRPAVAVAAHVRAADYRPFLSPWGHPGAMSRSGEIGIVSASLHTDCAGVPAAPGTVRLTDDSACVSCADGWVLLDTVLQNGEIRPAASVLDDGEILTPLASF